MYVFVRQDYKKSPVIPISQGDFLGKYVPNVMITLDYNSIFVKTISIMLTDQSMNGMD
jgi:hypothetical protein